MVFLCLSSVESGGGCAWAGGLLSWPGFLLAFNLCRGCWRFVGLLCVAGLAWLLAAWRRLSYHRARPVVVAVVRRSSLGGCPVVHTYPLLWPSWSCGLAFGLALHGARVPGWLLSGRPAGRCRCCPGLAHGRRITAAVGTWYAGGLRAGWCPCARRRLCPSALAGLVVLASFVGSKVCKGVFSLCRKIKNGCLS